MSPRNPAFRSYQRRMALAAVVYVAAIFAASTILHHRAAPSPEAIGVALVPGLAILFMIYAIARLLLELDDEYLRLLEVRKALFATALTLAGCSVWGVLEIFTVAGVLGLSAVGRRPCGRGHVQQGNAWHRGVCMNNRLKVLRAERNWSQQDLAEQLGVSRQSVNAIETGKYDPSLPLAFRIAELFALSIEAIFQRD